MSRATSRRNSGRGSATSSIKAVVPLSAKIEEAHSRGTTVLTHAPKSTGALAYDQFVEEVIDGGRTQKRGRSKAVGNPGTGAVDAA